MEKIGFSAACLKYFGKKKDQSNVEFMQEMRELNEQDRIELKDMLKTVGFDCTT